MKNIAITFKSQGASFSLSYHYHIQGLIYKLLSENKDYSDFLHENGYEADGKKFKLFTYSSLDGNKIVRGSEKYMYFPDFIHLNIRSVSEVFTDCLVRELQNRGSVNLMENVLSVYDIKPSQPEIVEDEISIKFLSPISAHITLGESGQTEFLTPFDPRFEKYMDQNFRRKYMSYYGSEPKSGILLEAQLIAKKDKYVTWFKSDYITGWRGKYKLSGDPEYLTFLYYTGLGSHNSAGFGMFAIEA